MELQGKDNTVLPLLQKQYAEAQRGIDNMLNAIQQGIITSSTKERLEELEKQKKEISAQIVKEEVYRPLLIDGLMQCGTTTAPTIRIEKSFRRYAESRMGEEFAGHLKIVAHPPKDGEPSADRSRLPARPVVAIGPEGGWTEDEVALLEGKGFLRYSLGSRILRTDTATISVVAQLMGR